jgi:GNAT superfamily N-acetyltransferase
MNLAIFERMPRPGRETGTWGYLANAFVLGPYRNQGIGALLLTALLAYADGQGYVRVVLRPSERAVPFYLRAGFEADGGFLVRYPPRR